MTTGTQSLQVHALPRLILLDRDGVINHDVGAPGVLHPSQLKLTNGAADAISNLRHQMGCRIAIITNQSCVGKGLIDEKNDLSMIHDTLRNMLLQENDNTIIDHIFYCTSLRNSNDYRMKPNPGMIHEACDYFQVESNECVMIGDAIRDLEAAAKAYIPIRI
jgi:D-glycero-D-manno-heptose 1,7-bisphosphate phosphatase